MWRKVSCSHFLVQTVQGKSTTIKMLTTLLKPTTGELFLAEHNVAKEQDAARKTFGIVFQDPSLDDELTAYENLELHGALYRVPSSVLKQRSQELLTLVELWERKKSKVKT